jgi:hypothetical protein
MDPGIVDLGTDWRRMVSFMPRSLHLEERAPSAHCIGGCVYPRTGLDHMVKRIILPLPGLEIQHRGLPTCSQSLYRLWY